MLKKEHLVALGVMLFTSLAFAQTGNYSAGAIVTPEIIITPYDGATALDAPGSSITSGDYEVLIGAGAGSKLSSGSQNVFIGTAAGAQQTTQNDNIIIGAFAGDQSTTGSDNVIIGTRAARTLNGTDNTVIGVEAGMVMELGANDNTIVGEEAGQALTTGDDNTFLGEDAGFNTTTASDNTFIGSTAGRSNTTGFQNAFVGYQAGYDNTTGFWNTAMGDSALIDGDIGFNNTAVGHGAGCATEDADYNTFIGAYAGADNNRTNSATNANRNTYVGAFSGFSNRVGEDNVGMGTFSGYGGTYATLTGVNGFWGGEGESTNRSRTTFIGAQAAADNNDVVVIGYRARVDGQYGIALGNESRAQQNYSVAIGYGVNVNQANTLALGGDNSGTGAFANNRLSVGIGTLAANRNASLHLADVDKGFLINRVTTAQRTTMTTTPASGTALTTTEEGLMVYDTDLDALYIWDGTAWTTSANTDEQAISLTTNTLSISGNAGTVDLAGYLDNTDSQNLTSATVNASNVLTVAIQGGTSVNVDLSPILSDLEAENTAQQVQIDDLIARMVIQEACGCNTLTTEDNEEETERHYGPILYQNIPNPFNGTTSIKYYVPLDNKNAAIIFSNNLGQIIDNVPLKKLGNGELFFNSDSLAKGMYYYTLYISGRKIDTKKMVIE